MNVEYKPLTIKNIDDIISLEDKELRSFVFTQAYYDLSVMIREVLKPPKSPLGEVEPERDANFWTFLIWSAASVTMNFRPFRPRLANQGFRPSARARRFLTPIAMQALARGEEDAFSDTARIAVTFCKQMSKTRRPKPEEVANACLDSLSRTHRSVRDDEDIKKGIVALCKAVDIGDRTYTEKQRENYVDDLKSRSELILLSSIHLDAAEQKLVQRPLQEAFHAIPNQFLGMGPEEPNSRIHPHRRRLSRAATRRIAPVLRDTSARFTTRWVFSVNLPTETVSLGRDLPMHSNGVRFPEPLNNIRSHDLKKLIRRFDNSHMNGTGTAAKNWTDYDDRMSFIVNYLRLYQRRINPKDAPYTDFQARRIRAFKLPWLEPGEDGELLRNLDETPRAETWGEKW